MATLPRTSRPTAHVHHWQAQFLWILGAGVLDFAMTGLFTTVLQVSREWWVVAHLAAASLLAISYIRWANIKITEVIRRHWLAEVIVGAIVAAGVTYSMLTTQTAAPRDHGLTFIWEIVWLGMLYGAADAVLLNVLPVYALWQASRDLGHATTWRGKILTGAVALLASAVVTAMYHAGYAEFRSADMGQPVFGNTLITLGYVLSGNPIAAFIGHIALHVSSVVHGITSTATLPPHY